MKKAVVDRRIVDVIDQDEFIRRSKLDPESIKLMSEDTAVEGPNGKIYPVTKQYSSDSPCAYDAGPMILYNMPEEYKNNEQYQQKNVINFEDVSSLKESIEKQAALEKAERSILISPDNIFTPLPQENDTPEMSVLKKAITRKNIDIDNYKQRFGSDYNNDKRLFDQSSITFFKLKRVCEIFDIKATLILEDKPGAPNPIGEKLSAVITREGNE